MSEPLYWFYMPAIYVELHSWYNISTRHTSVAAAYTDSSGSTHARPAVVQELVLRYPGGTTGWVSWTVRCSLSTLFVWDSSYTAYSCRFCCCDPVFHSPCTPINRETTRWSGLIDHARCLGSVAARFALKEGCAQRRPVLSEGGDTSFVRVGVSSIGVRRMSTFVCSYAPRLR